MNGQEYNWSKGETVSWICCECHCHVCEMHSAHMFLFCWLAQNEKPYFWYFRLQQMLFFLPFFQIMILNIQHNFKVSVYETRSDKECRDLGVYCQCINNKHCFLKFLSVPWKGCAEAAWADFWILCKKVVSNSSQYFCFLLFIYLYLFFVYLYLYSLYIYI